MKQREVNYCIYHPLYSVANPITHNTFMDTTEWIAKRLTKCDHSNKLLVVGDISLHVNNPSDGDAGNFCDMMATLSLGHHISFPIYKAGNTLNLVFTEVGTDQATWNSRPGSYCSHHCPVTIRRCITELLSTGKLIKLI